MTLDLITNGSVIQVMKCEALLKSLINEWTYQIKLLKLINEEETSQLQRTKGWRERMKTWREEDLTWSMKKWSPRFLRWKLKYILQFMCVEI